MKHKGYAAPRSHPRADEASAVVKRISDDAFMTMRQIVEDFFKRLKDQKPIRIRRRMW